MGMSTDCFPGKGVFTKGWRLAIPITSTAVPQRQMNANQTSHTMNLTVNEIFYSIQGESVHTGLPCVFVRLTGCNLRCTYCDTQYAFDEGRFMSVADILRQVGQFGCGLVEITGGEPLFQSHTPALAGKLLESGYQVLVETNGSLDIDRVDRRCSRIMDVKCPSSGEQSRNDSANLNRITPNDQVKFVIAATGTIFLSPNRWYPDCRRLCLRIGSSIQRCPAGCPRINWHDGCWTRAQGPGSSCNCTA
jgi:organic radical activating enzyme